MRIGQVGFGRAGRPVAAALVTAESVSLEWAVRRSHAFEHRAVAELLAVSDGTSGALYSTSGLSAAELFDRAPVDVVVDFSSETGIHFYGEEAKRRAVTVITAVSQYSDTGLKYLRSIAEHTRVLCSPNITLGVNFLILAAGILRRLAPHADVEIVEQHFRGKRGTSSTASRIADALALPEGAIKSVRVGGIIGVHEIVFGFPHETVRLTHESISREAFGAGVLFAARCLEGKPDGFYTMEDLLQPYFELESSRPAALL